MKRNYSAFSMEVTVFSQEDVIRTSGEDYSKDIVKGNEDFTDGLVGSFGGFTD